MSDGNPKMRAMFGGEISGGFFGIPVAAPGDVGNADIVLMGAPSATPYTSVGPYCAGAPDAIHSAFGWPGVIDHHDFDLGGKILPEGVTALDWGNLPYHASNFESNRATIRQQVKAVLDNGAVPLVMGGDDSIPIPVLQAYENYGPITIVQLDAHIDGRDEVAGERFGLSSNMRRASEMNWVENIIQVGARGIGSARPADYQDALDWGVQFFPMQNVMADGLGPVLAAVPKDTPVFITLDIDSMDPAIVPAVIGPAPGGLDYWQVLEIIKGVAGKAKIVGFDLAELMSDNDIGGRGALVAARIVAVMMGLVSRQR